MAIARKCDRCKTCYDPANLGSGHEMARFQNPTFQSSEDYRLCRVTERLIEGEPDAWVDLCPTCALAFNFFMKGFDICSTETFEEEVDQ